MMKKYDSEFKLQTVHSSWQRVVSRISSTTFRSRQCTVKLAMEFVDGESVPVFGYQNVIELKPDGAVISEKA